MPIMVDVERALNGDEEKPRVIRLRGFFSDPEGNLRRGVPTWVVGEDGQDIPVFREHNTGTIFPREVAPDVSADTSEGGGIKIIPALKGRDFTPMS